MLFVGQTLVLVVNRSTSACRVLQNSRTLLAYSAARRGASGVAARL